MIQNKDIYIYILTTYDLARRVNRAMFAVVDGGSVVKTNLTPEYEQSQVCELECIYEALAWMTENSVGCSVTFRMQGRHTVNALRDLATGSGTTVITLSEETRESLARVKALWDDRTNIRELTFDENQSPVMEYLRQILWQMMDMDRQLAWEEI